jgi:hypothetical protein
MSEITYSRLVRTDLERIGEIDRTERTDTLYVQHGDRLDRRFGDSARRRGSRKGRGEYSVAQLVGIGIVSPHIRPGIAHFAFLYVRSAHRARIMGVPLPEAEEVDQLLCPSPLLRLRGRFRARPSAKAERLRCLAAQPTPALSRRRCGARADLSAVADVDPQSL